MVSGKPGVSEIFRDTKKNDQIKIIHLIGRKSVKGVKVSEKNETGIGFVIRIIY
jgi:hypothetical protein